MMYCHSEYRPLGHKMYNNVESWSNREMEFTQLNTSDGEWHMVTAPRTELQCRSEVKRDQQDQLEGEFFNNLPRAHFLHPGYFRTASEPSAFSPYVHDHHVKGKGLQDQFPRDSESYGCIPPSSRPHPLAQPGFYSPKIPRSKYYEPVLSTTKAATNKSMKEFNSYTLPLPHSKTAVLNKSGLCCKPQGVKTSVVERPRLMRATISQISPDSNHRDQQQYHSQLQHIRKQDIQDQYLRSQHQTAENLPSTKVSKKEDSLWNHYGQPQSKQFHPKQNQSSFTVPKCAQDSYEINMFPQSPSVDQSTMRLSVQSSSYCKLSVFNGKHNHNTQESDCYQQSSRLHNHMVQLNSLKDLRKTNSPSDVGSNVSSNRSQVDKSSKNVFGQPRMTATLRPACSPRSVRKSTMVEDLKKLIVMDDIMEKSQRDSPLLNTRTNSSFSELIPDSASSSPVFSRHPLCRPSHLSLQDSPTVCQPMPTESPVWDRDLEFDRGLMPLPNTAHDLDWDSLVSTAEAYEMQRRTNFLSVGPNNMLSGTSPAPHSPAYSGHVSPSVSGDTDDVFTDLPDQLSHLEVVLRRLSRDLLKEKKDKVALLAEMLKLRMSNQHLKEESLSANAQLHKICQVFNISAYGIEDERK